MKDILICPKCGEKLTDSGIKEVTVGGTTETDIYFGLPAEIELIDRKLTSKIVTRNGSYVLHAEKSYMIELLPK